MSELIWDCPKCACVNLDNECSLCGHTRASPTPSDDGEGVLDRLIEALEFYADPKIYEPHPHGPAFDRRDLSFYAKNALAALNKGAGRD